MDEGLALLAPVKRRCGDLTLTLTLILTLTLTLTLILTLTLTLTLTLILTKVRRPFIVGRPHRPRRRYGEIWGDVGRS